MNIVSLFTGIGGVELGLHRAGHETRLMCEIDSGAAEVLSHRFPGIPLHRDVRTLNKLPSSADIVTAGFPCQDLSQAGGTKGLTGRNSGLVDEVFRLLESRPVEWVLIENVPFMLQLHGGAAIRHIADRFEELGYRWAYRLIDTRAFGLPQRRERVFLLASLSHDPAALLFSGNREPVMPPDHAGRACGFYWTEGTRGLGWAVDAIPTLKGGSTVGIPSSPGIWMPDGRIVTPDLRDAERLQGFPADWTKPAENAGRASYRWKLVGNAVTVNVAAWIGRSLRKPAHKSAFAGEPFAQSRSWPKAAFGSKEGRFSVEISTWPVALTPKPLASFLRFPVRLLSFKAVHGFLDRLTASSLRYPDDFLEALKMHESRMSQQAEVA